MVAAASARMACAWAWIARAVSVRLGTAVAAWISARISLADLTALLVAVSPAGPARSSQIAASARCPSARLDGQDQVDELRIGDLRARRQVGLDRAVDPCLVGLRGLPEPLDWQKEFNTQINKIRYIIEQAIANFKTWRIMHTDYRRPLATLPQTISAAVALHFYAVA